MSLLHDKPALQGKVRKLWGPIAEASDLLGQVRIGRIDPSTWPHRHESPRDTRGLTILEDKSYGIERYLEDAPYYSLSRLKLSFSI